MQKQFETLSIFSVISGRLLNDMKGIYQILSFYSDREVYTHELPKLADQFSPTIISQYPKFQKWIPIINDMCSNGKIKEVCNQIVSTFGESLILTKIA